MLAKRNFTLNRDDGSQRAYKVGDEIEARDADHWYVHGTPPGSVREELLSRIPPSGSVAAVPVNVLGADRTDGPSRDPADVRDIHARIDALESAHFGFRDEVNSILAKAGLFDAAKDPIPQAAADNGEKDQSAADSKPAKK